jgi:hypothetical protein
MGKKSGSGSGMNNPDHISESLEILFWVKYLKFFMRIRDGINSDPGCGMEKIRMRDTHPGSATLAEAKHTGTTAKNDEQSCGCKYPGATHKKCGVHELCTRSLSEIQE